MWLSTHFGDFLRRFRTLIDSTPGVRDAWILFGKDYDFDGAEAAEATHGVRLIDSLSKYCKLDGQPEKLAAEVMRFEEHVLDIGPVALPGVLDLIKQVSELNHAEKDWSLN